MFRNLILVSLVLVLALPAVAADPPVKKVAVLVGIDEYKNAMPANLVGPPVVLVPVR